MGFLLFVKNLIFSLASLVGTRGSGLCGLSAPPHRESHRESGVRRHPGAARYMRVRVSQRHTSFYVEALEESTCKKYTGWIDGTRVLGFLRRHPSAASYPGLEAELAPGLADARILADGELIAHTDASGYALVSLAEAPRLLEATLAGWRIIGGDDWERGRVFDGRHEVVLWMDRE